MHGSADSRTSFGFQILWLLPALIIYAGCLQETRGTPENPVKDNDSAFAHSVTWRNADPRSSFLAVEIESNETSDYEIKIHAYVSWDASRAYVLHHVFLRGMNDSAFAIAGQSIEARSSCQLYPEVKMDNECAPHEFLLNKTSRMASTLQPGRYLLLARAFGANESELSITFSSNHSVRAAEVQEGRTSIVLLKEQVREGNVSFDASAVWEADAPFLGTFRAAGPHSRPAWSAEGPNANHSFDPAQPTYRDGAGRITLEPTFPGTSGFWGLDARGGSHSTEGPAYATLGVVHSPFFVNETGQMRQYGPTK